MLHSGETIKRGTKVSMRTDIMYELESRPFDFRNKVMLLMRKLTNLPELCLALVLLFFACMKGIAL